MHQELTFIGLGGGPLAPSPYVAHPNPHRQAFTPQKYKLYEGKGFDLLSNIVKAN